MSQTITVDGDEVIDATIDGEAVEEITIDGVLAWAAEVGLDGLTVTRQDGSYTASSGEHVVSNGGTITLPSPVQDGIVMVTKVKTRPELTGTVDGISDPYISGDESAVFVSDGNEWYSVDRNQISAIPDSVTNYWPADEGKNQTLQPSTGSADITLDFDRWVSGSEYQGGAAVNLGSNERMSTDSGDLDIMGDKASATVWVDSIGTSGGGFTCYMRSSVNYSQGQTSGNQGGGSWQIGKNTGETKKVIVRFVEDDGTVNTVIDASTTVNYSTTHGMIGISVSGNNVDVYLYDDTGFAEKLSSSAIRGSSDPSTNDIDIGYGDNGGDSITGPFDAPTVAQNAALSRTEMDEIYNNTGKNA